MFTGLVDAQAKVVEFKKLSGGYRLGLRVPKSYRRLAVGSSVCVDGCCLTVVRKRGTKLSFDLVPETLKRTYFRKLSRNDRLNLERPMRWRGRVEGHLVQGHVDGVVTLIKKKSHGRAADYEFNIPSRMRRYLVEKGSVALNGVSLTIGKVRKARTFWVHLVPHTLKKTSLGSIAPGQPVNVETDLWLKVRGH